MKLVKTYGRSARVAGELIEAIERRGATNTAKVENTVAKILTGVRQGGDSALIDFAEQLDGLSKDDSLLVSRAEMEAAWEETAPELRAAMEVAQANIRAFAEAQRPGEWMISLWME